MSKRRVVAVAAMRLQVPEPTPGHLAFINYITVNHRSIARERFGADCNFEFMLALGVHGGLRTGHDPLTFDERAEMFRDTPGLPHDYIKVVGLRDHPWSEERWCDWLDGKVTETYGEPVETIHYGSRDSYLRLYERHRRLGNTHIVPELPGVSGTAVRQSIVYSPKLTWRQVICHEQQKRHPTAYSTADVAILDKRQQRVLVGRKHWYDGKWSLIGGFFDPEKDATDLDNAKREQGEEVPSVVTSDEYIQLGPRLKIDDPRYRASKDRIMTTLFATEYLGGEIDGGDDIKFTRWMSREELRDGQNLVPWHHPLAQRIEELWRGADWAYKPAA